MQSQRHLSEHVGFGKKCEYPDDGGAGPDWRVGDDGVEVSGANGGKCGVGVCVWVFSGGDASDLFG